MEKYPEKIPIIELSICINCDECVKICPSEAIRNKNNYSCSKCVKYCLTMEVPCNQDHYIFCYDKCDGCGLCIKICPVNAISWFNITQKINKNELKIDTNK